MGCQKIINLLGNIDEYDLKYATKKWYMINDQNNDQYGNDSSVKFDTKIIKQNLCDYSDSYILVTGDIAIVGGNGNTDIAFKNCSIFTRCTTHLHDEHIETAENLDIVMNMYNLSEYSDNYFETSGSLWQYKRDELNMNNNNIANVTTADSSSFKYKSGLFFIF